MTWLDHIDLLRCPDCRGRVHCDGLSGLYALVCEECRRYYEIRDGIPILLPHEWTPFAKSSVEWFQENETFFQRRFEEVIEGRGSVPFGLLEYAPAGGMALDCGSGAGLVTVINALRGFLSVGIEVSYHGAAYGAELARRFGVTNCLFAVADAAQLPFRAGTFDLVTAYGVIEHVHAPERFVQEMASVTRLGGICIAYEINRFIDPVLAVFRRRFSVDKLVLFFRGLLPFFRARRRRRFEESLLLDLSPPAVEGQAARRGQVAAYLPLSYLVKDRFARHFDLVAYRTHLLYLDPVRYVVNGKLELIARPVKVHTRAIAALYHSLDRFPLLKHTGEAIFLVGKKR